MDLGARMFPLIVLKVGDTPPTQSERIKRFLHLEEHYTKIETFLSSSIHQKTLEIENAMLEREMLITQIKKLLSQYKAIPNNEPAKSTRENILETIKGAFLERKKIDQIIDKTYELSNPHYGRIKKMYLDITDTSKWFNNKEPLSRRYISEIYRDLSKNSISLLNKILDTPTDSEPLMEEFVKLEEQILRLRTIQNLYEEHSNWFVVLASKKESKEEREVYKRLESLIDAIIKNDKTVIENQTKMINLEIRLLQEERNPRKVNEEEIVDVFENASQGGVDENILPEEEKEEPVTVITVEEMEIVKVKLEKIPLKVRVEDYVGKLENEIILVQARSGEGELSEAVKKSVVDLQLRIEQLKYLLDK